MPEIMTKTKNTYSSEPSDSLDNVIGKLQNEAIYSSILLDHFGRTPDVSPITKALPRSPLVTAKLFQIELEEGNEVPITLFAKVYDAEESNKISYSSAGLRKIHYQSEHLKFWIESKIHTPPYHLLVNGIKDGAAALVFDYWAESPHDHNVIAINYEIEKRENKLQNDKFLTEDQRSISINEISVYTKLKDQIINSILECINDFDRKTSNYNKKQLPIFKPDYSYYKQKISEEATNYMLWKKVDLGNLEVDIIRSNNFDNNQINLLNNFKKEFLAEFDTILRKVADEKYYRYNQGDQTIYHFSYHLNADGETKSAIIDADRSRLSRPELSEAKLLVSHLLNLNYDESYNFSKNSTHPKKFNPYDSDCIKLFENFFLLGKWSDNVLNNKMIHDSLASKQVTYKPNFPPQDFLLPGFPKMISMESYDSHNAIRILEKTLVERINKMVDGDVHYKIPPKDVKQLINLKDILKKYNLFE